jgi:DNA mismatch repair protein MutS
MAVICRLWPCLVEVVPSLKVISFMSPADGSHRSYLTHLTQRLHDLTPICQEIQRAICDEPPMQIKEGGVFREGWLPELDELRNATTLGRQWIADLQNREIERTGIKSLKIKYNAVFGYFIEITKANVGSVPADYHRKQTTVNGERYITDELKRMEDKILGSEERSKALEYEQFIELRSRVLGAPRAHPGNRRSHRRARFTRLARRNRAALQLHPPRAQ